MNSRGFTNVAVIITQDVHVPSKHHDASGDPFLPVKIHKITSCETLQLLCIWIAKFLIYYTLLQKTSFGQKSYSMILIFIKCLAHQNLKDHRPLFMINKHFRKLLNIRENLWKIVMSLLVKKAPNLANCT